MAVNKRVALQRRGCNSARDTNDYVGRYDRDFADERNARIAERPSESVARLIKGARGITKGVRERQGVLLTINFQRSHNRAERIS